MNAPSPEKYLEQMLETARRAQQAEKSESDRAAYHQPMNAVPREELDAKLQAIEARMDGRIATIEGKFNLMFQRMDQMGGRMDEVRQAMSNLRWWVAGAALTVLFGVAAFNATVLSNMIASFESGKNTATAITQATEQLKTTQEQLRALTESLQRPAAPAK